MLTLSTFLLTACWAADTSAPGRGELESAWRDYRRVFIQDDGRVVDRAGGHATTSEGQSYAMIRAVWVDDRDTFDRVARWTVDNLQGHDPTALAAWKWGHRDDGSWGVYDESPASDADLWMSYALLLGAERWEAPALKTRALALMAAIWEQETLEVSGRRVLLPGPWAREGAQVKLNPSYAMPFIYRAFHSADPERGWDRLLADSYWLLEQVMADGLPPDWVWMDKETGALGGDPEGAGKSPEEAGAAFGYEAFRVMWTLAAEAQWYEEARAKRLLETLEVLRSRWHREGELPAVINPDGTPGRPYPSLGLYGAILPVWALSAPDDARALYKHKIHPHRTVSGWGDTEDYYAHNWVWFGLALWSGVANAPKSL
jgi:endo-1,4-beta-D-glucanase Y